jgi:hypothetical protein
MKTKIVLVLLMVVVSGCYRPNWHRANTTYAELNADSYWCKTQTKVGAPRSEIIEQYEVCMKGKGYQLGGGQAEVGVKSPTDTIEQREGQTGVDKNTKVYVFLTLTAGNPGAAGSKAYKHFHKKGCKHLWSVSTKEVTAGEAIANGKSMCPDCFREAIEQREGQTGLEESGVDKNTKVYVTLQRGDRGGMGQMPAHRYFHQKDCRYIWSLPTKEVTAGEAIADGKSMCPDCFR